MYFYFYKTAMVMFMLGLVSSLPQPEPEVNVNININVNKNGVINEPPDGINTTWCPIREGFFVPEGTDVCFKEFIDAFTWPQGNLKCKSEDLQVAETRSEVIGVNTGRYLQNKYGNYDIWLGAQGNICTNAEGTMTSAIFKWERDDEQISNNSPLWQPGQPAPSEEQPKGTCGGYCLVMYNTALSDPINGKVANWRAKNCTNITPVLCQLVQP